MLAARNRHQWSSEAAHRAASSNVRFQGADSTGRRNTLALYLARWNGMQMEGHARTWVTPKLKAKP
jgi:hypothetical protein